MMSQDAIKRLKESVEIPVIMAPMFIVSSPKMVVNACASGIIGTFPALNARTSDILEDWMKEINTEVDRLKVENPKKKIAPWGINYIVHRSNKRLAEDLNLIEKYQPPIVITSLGDPGPVAEIVRAYDGIVLSDVINIKLAKKAIEKGADGLVLVSAGAGGHGGTYNPISFVHEVREFFDGPIVLFGGMTKGEDVLATELLGADFSYMGTRFIPSVEASAEDAYKDMITEASIEDILYTDAFSGLNANYLIPSIVRAGIDPANLKKKKDVDFSNSANSEVKAWRDAWGAGHGVGSIHHVQTVAEITRELKERYEEAIKYISEKGDRNSKEEEK